METESLEDNAAPYFHVKQDVTPWLHLSGGLRVNFNSKYATEPAYRYGVSADVDENTKVYVSAARAFRTPALAVQCIPFSGDIRHGSVKMVASAVGECSMVVMYVHRYLNEV